MPWTIWPFLGTCPADRPEHRIMVFTAIRRPSTSTVLLLLLCYSSSKWDSIPNSVVDETESAQYWYRQVPQEDGYGVQIFHIIPYLFDYNAMDQQYIRLIIIGSIPILLIVLYAVSAVAGRAGLWTCTYMYAHVSQLSTLLRDCRNIVQAPCLE